MSWYLTLRSQDLKKQVCAWVTASEPLQEGNEGKGRQVEDLASSEDELACNFRLS